MATKYTNLPKPTHTGRFGAREATQSIKCNAMLEGDDDENLTLSADEAFHFVRAANAGGGATVTLPAAAASKYRTIKVYSRLGAVTVAVPAGDSLNGTLDGTELLSAAGEWIEVFCDGSDWAIVSHNITI